MDNQELSSNLVQLYLARVDRFRDRKALFYKTRPSGDYVGWTWKEWAAKVEAAAFALHAASVRRGDRVGILSENRPEWTVADLGILSLGAVTVPIYPTSSCKDIRYILENAGIEVLFVSTQEQQARIQEALSGYQALRMLVLFDGPGFDGFLKKGEEEKKRSPDTVRQEIDKTSPEDLATLIYTSGTTGPPKGVMLTHRNFVANYLGASEVIEVREDDVALSFLPLSHVFERLAGYYFMIFHGAAIAYAESMQSVPDDMMKVRPTIAASVPRLYEKMHARIMEKIEHASPLRKALFAWAVKTGREYAAVNLRKKQPSPALKFKRGIAALLVFNKLRGKLGGRIRFFISGGAPLSKELAEFFYAAGVVILEGYGLTETSPVIAVNCPNALKLGTVGKPLPNVEVKIAEDGEILTKGPCVMKGYYKNPEATRQVFDGDWFRTGDIGEIDAEGFLKITDRKKDIIVTSGGKNISPQNIENTLTADRIFLQAVVVGDKRNYLVALIVPNRTEFEGHAAALGLQRPWAELLKDPQILQWAEEHIKAKTANLARYEQIKYFTLLEKDLTVEGGELTPTLKIKRKAVLEKFQSVVEAMYQKGESFRTVS
ncbi:MAG TPA: long-chain fatty acid--CoA ligase [Verrucomicrobiae bacterium]|jgi:long-chain acyl-CoA synthetase|nr:long-chain fatty acid--CoA ligase [Verrucomicrobiae bacterium]